MSFDFLKQYIVPIGKSGNKHTFHNLNINDIKLINQAISIPFELCDFYSKIGYGFMFDLNDSYSIDRFLSPEEFMKINLRKDYYEFDPTLEIFNSIGYEDKYIFFEVVEGNYLLIAKKDINGKNAIYFFDDKIADSLESFLIKFDSEGHFFEDNNVIE